jgi:hypothetical protein
MGMTRRQILRLLALGVGSLELDIDSLLWVPGKKTIFIPDVPKHVSMSQIVAAELERIVPHIRSIFERDDLFYEVLAKEAHIMSERAMKVPLELKPGYVKSRDGKIH